MNQHLLKSALTISSAILLAACGADDDKDNTVSIKEGSYVVQLNKEVAVGNLTGDRTPTQELLTTTGTDYALSTYQSTLYHLGRFGVDRVTRYDRELAKDKAIWEFSSNDANSPISANPYELVQNADDNAYLIRYGATTAWQVDPSATQEADFIKATIDLSAYTVTGENAATDPRMSDAAIVNNTLFVIVQRLDGSWAPQTPYLVAIDLSTNQEIDTNPQQDGLKGIPLNTPNPFNIEAHNGYLYVSGHGPYNSSEAGGIDKIDASTYQVTNLVNKDTLSYLSIPSEDIYPHIQDIAVVRGNKAYTIIHREQKWNTLSSTLHELNPETGELKAPLTLPELTGKQLRDIAVGPNGRLWVSVHDADDPKLLVIDTDTNTLADNIDLNSTAIDIDFLVIDR